MTTTTTARMTVGAPLSEVGEGPPPRRPWSGSVVAVVTFAIALVLLRLTQVVPPGAVLAGVGLWLVLRLGVRVRSI